MSNLGIGLRRSVQSSIGQRPERMHIANLVDGSDIQMQYNPTEVTEELDAVYQRLTIQGMSHQQLQYTNTSNLKIDCELAFDALAQVGPHRFDVDGARRYLQSLFYGSRAASDITSAAPPSILFVWPNLYTFKAKAIKYKGKGSRFALDGSLTGFVVQLTVEEVRDMRLYSEDVRLQGTLRATSGPEVL